MWDTIKYSNIGITGIPKSRRESEPEKAFENRNSFFLEKLHFHLRVWLFYFILLKFPFVKKKKRNIIVSGNYFVMALSLQNKMLALPYWSEIISNVKRSLFHNILNNGTAVLRTVCPVALGTWTSFKKNNNH